MLINLAEELEQEASPEKILFAVIGSEDYCEEGRVSEDVMGKCMPWEEARKHLDYEYNNGFGGADCNPVYAWTEENILTISEYDGSTDVRKVPRNPVDIKPSFS